LHRCLHQLLANQQRRGHFLSKWQAKQDAGKPWLWTPKTPENPTKKAVCLMKANGLP